MSTFIHDCLNGLCDPSDVDDYIDEWHIDNHTKLPLHVFLGMDWEEYAEFVRKGDSYIEEILADRRKYCVCGNCMDNKKDYITEYWTQDRETDSEIFGETIHYTETIAFCKECGSEVCPTYLLDRDVITVHDGYRRKIGVIEAQEIERILRKNNISPDAADKELGWELGTIQTLCHRIPTKEQSKAIWDFAKKLEEAK